MNFAAWPFGVLLGCLLAFAGPAADLQAQTIDAGGKSREYILASAKANQGPLPLVLVLHGHRGHSQECAPRRPAALAPVAWLDIVDREGILVAALQGLKGSDDRTGWRDYRSDAVRNPRADDVAFANAVVRTLVAAGKADVHRLYVMGMSNGAMMSLRLAIEMRPAPAAIAAASGSMAAHSECRAPEAPVSVLIIHGAEDPLVPYGVAAWASAALPPAAR